MAKRQAARQYSANSNQNKNLLTQQSVQQHNQQFNNNASTNFPSSSGPIQANHAVGLASNLGASQSASNLQSSGRHIRGRTWDSQSRSKSSTNIGSNAQTNSTNGPVRRTSSQEQLKQTNILNNTDYPPPHHKGQWAQPSSSSQSSMSSANSNNLQQYEPKYTNSVQDAWQQPASAASLGSGHFHYAMQQQQMQGGMVGSNIRNVAQQQRLQEQKQISYDMTQQSKAKHQEQVGVYPVLFVEVT